VPDRSAAPLPGLDAYKTLQVDPEADPEVIQAAYRRLARKFHPDVAPGQEAAARMIAINAAWEMLNDATKRAAYDRQRASAHRTAGHPASGQAGDATTGQPRHATPGAATRRATTGSDANGPTATGPAATGSDAEAGRGTTGHGKRGSKPDPSTSAGSGWGPEAPASFGASERGAPRTPETVSPDWTSGRSTSGGGYDPDTMRAPEGHGAAGPPPGSPSGSVLNFGRFAGWSLGEIARVDVEYLEWLDRAPIGRAHREELDGLLRRLGRRRSAGPGDDDKRHGLFRR
jgi:curved DNA-binding protein CbpA